MRRIDVESLLTRKLRLANPLFKLRRIGSKIAGSIVSDTFRRKGDHQRQKMIWDALEAEFGAEAARKFGTLLAYTWDEWDIDLPAKAG